MKSNFWHFVFDNTVIQYMSIGYKVWGLYCKNITYLRSTDLVEI